MGGIKAIWQNDNTCCIVVSHVEKKVKVPGRNSLGEEDSGGEVVSKAENFGYPVIPVKVFVIYIQQVATRHWLDRRVQNVKGFMN